GGRVVHDPEPNTGKPEAAYQHRGAGAVEQTRGRITHLVAGMGTGGTISGTGRYLKEKNPKVEVIGADPVGSILKLYHDTGKIGEARTYKIEGVGEDFIPTATDFSLIDRVISCGDREGLNTPPPLSHDHPLFTATATPPR